MAGQYKQQAPRSAPPPQRPSGGEFVGRRPPERRDFRPQRQEQQPFRKPENLQILREALKKTLESKKQEQEETTQPLNHSTNSGTLKPGEKIEL